MDLQCANDPEEALADAIATGDVTHIPGRFKRLNSPRCSKRQPDPIKSTLQAQLNCLPMAYAAELEGHLRDLRTLLGPEVWNRVQEGVLLRCWNTVQATIPR